MADVNALSSVRSLLKRLGLQEKEIEVYLSLLSLKTARVSDTAKAAKQSRSHTYLILQSLLQKGLISEIERGKIIHYVAESPERLVQYVQNKKEELAELEQLAEGALPLLKNLSPTLTGKPRVTMLQGLEGTKQVYRDLLSQDFIAFFNAEKMFEAFGTNVVHLLFGKEAKLRGRELFIDNAAARRYIEEVHTDETYQIRLLPKETQFASEVIVFSDVVALFSYDDEKTIIRIENKNIADMYRALFEQLWGTAKES